MEGIEIEEIVKRKPISSDSEVYKVIKRIMDIIIAICAIILLMPLFLMVFILIIADSGKPAMFMQIRCGMLGKLFKMYKFRTMVVSAEDAIEQLKSRNEVDGHMFKIRNDPRITKFGAFLRKTSLDELPQLFNVIKGDMSIVGPRPPLPSEVFSYSSWHKLRLSVKTGITGLWQVSGRNNVGFEEMVRLDIKYIRERNIWNDIRIIFKTIPVIFRLSGM